MDPELTARLKDLDGDRLTDLTSAALRDAAGVPAEYPTEPLDDLSDEERAALEARRAELAAIDQAIDEAAHDPATLRALASCLDLDAEVHAWSAIVAEAIEKRDATARPIRQGIAIAGRIFVKLLRRGDQASHIDVRH